MSKTVSVWKAYPGAPNIRRAEKSGAGTLPAGAFQYCEAMRTASSFGWYVYAPKDISLVFDGREVFYYEDGQWFPLKSISFEDEFREQWRSQAPDDLKDYDPPFMSELFVPGAIQIWSGYFVSTSPDWSLLVRQPANYDIRSSFSTFEGLVETDRFRPWPLFINIRLLTTDREIFISKERPLFQMQPIPRQAYQSSAFEMDLNQQLVAEDQSISWDGVRHTVRKIENKETRRPGSYAVDARKRVA
ncbi:MAG: DUF6065 family protein [Pseudomonadota bacterium]